MANHACLLHWEEATLLSKDSKQAYPLFWRNTLFLTFNVVHSSTSLKRSLGKLYSQCLSSKTWRHTRDTRRIVSHSYSIMLVNVTKCSLWFCIYYAGICLLDCLLGQGWCEVYNLTYKLKFKERLKEVYLLSIVATIFYYLLSCFISFLKKQLYVLLLPQGMRVEFSDTYITE